MKKKPFDTESDARVWLIDLLKDKGMTDVTDVKYRNFYSNYDVSARYKNRLIKFCIKNRDVDTYTYPTTELDSVKYSKLRNECCDAMILVVCYNNQYIMINLNTTSPDQTIEKMASSSTRFGNGEKKLKKMVSWYISKQKLYNY